MKRLNNKGAMTAPWDTHAFISIGRKAEAPTRTENKRSSR